MATKTKSPRFRSVDSHSVAGGGPTPLELVKLPTPVWLIWFVLRFPFRHRVFGLFIAVGLFSMFNGLSLTQLFTILISSLITATLALYLYTYCRYSYAPTFIRLTQAIRRRWHVKRRWPKAIKAAGFNTSKTLRRVKYTPNGLVGTFACDEGKTSQDLQNGAQDIAAVLRANEIKVDVHVPFEAVVSIMWGDPTQRILFPEDLSEHQSQDQEKVTFALDSDQLPLEVSITTSLLIIGESESGKSNCFWSLLNGLNVKELPYRLWIIDPAGGVELNELEGAPFTVKYASKADESSEIIDAALSAMHRRLESLKAEGSRKYEISEAYPLNIVVVDELLLLSRYDQHSALGQILSSGRKAGFIVIALSQLSQVDALGRARDLFPQRICHATKSWEMTDAALGTGAEAAGAHCSRISKRTPGVGYYFSLQTRLYTRFRTPLISDHNTRIISQGNIIQRTITNHPIRTKLKRRVGKRRTSVYQYYGEYRGELGRLLYVGIAYDPKKRWSQHCAADNEQWCPNDVDPALTEIEWYPSRPEAKARETELIKSEHPVYNKQERDDYL